MNTIKRSWWWCACLRSDLRGNLSPCGCTAPLHPARCSATSDVSHLHTFSAFALLSVQPHCLRHYRDISSRSTSPSLMWIFISQMLQTAGSYKAVTAVDIILNVLCFCNHWTHKVLKRSQMLEKKCPCVFFSLECCKDAVLLFLFATCKLYTLCSLLQDVSSLPVFTGISQTHPSYVFLLWIFQKGVDKMQAETHHWWPSSHCLLLFLALSVSLFVLPGFPVISPTVFIFLCASSLFFLSPPAVYHTHPSLVLQHCFLLFSSAFLHLFPPVCLFIPLICSCASSLFP